MHRDGLTGLGPKSRAWLAEQGVADGTALAQRDAVELWLAIKAAQPAASLNLLYALVGAQQGRHWRDIARERRTDLALELDARRAARPAAR